jgi:hypothetical protein
MWENQPGVGKICGSGICACDLFRPTSSNTTARELVVPWSRARTNGIETSR